MNTDLLMRTLKKEFSPQKNKQWTSNKELYKKIERVFSKVPLPMEAKIALAKDIIKSMDEAMAVNMEKNRKIEELNSVLDQIKEENGYTEFQSGKKILNGS